jgi:molybdenum cofactor sulfurtransferase
MDLFSLFSDLPILSYQTSSRSGAMTVANKPEGSTQLPEWNTDSERLAFDAFRREFPGYEKTARIDALRAKEYARLDETGHVYLDYTGGGLYSDFQLNEHMALLKRNVYGNPHSSNPSSFASTQLDEHARGYVLQYFNASPEEYVVIFTQNASGALKLLGESYPFGGDSRYLLTFDNHNAVNGIREFARAKGASITYVPIVAPELRIDGENLMGQLAKPGPIGPKLFVYPAQSNFSGVQHSLEYIAQAQSHGWDVVLDAAAFVPTNRLDLSTYHPDFVPISFYKIFGYPTGVGCLIAKKSALRKLRRPWFSGGTIEMASVQGDRYYLSQGEKAFEDGTVDYLNLPAIETGLKFLETIGVDAIHDRVICLTAWLLENLLSLRHTNNRPMVEVFGPREMVQRGGTIALNFLDPEGKVFNFHDIESAASRVRISLRTGCFCNPGAGEIAFGLTKMDMVSCFDNEERLSFEQCIVAVRGKTAGAVRVSLGLVSNFADVYRFLQFARTFADRPAI